MALSATSCAPAPVTKNRVCSPDNWCWYGPHPQGGALFGIWGSTSNNVWAVGDDGALIHWNGAYWQGSSSNTAKHLRDVWGSGASDVWAVGYGGWSFTGTEPPGRT